MSNVKWQLLSQHLKAMSRANGEFEDLILLVSQLVQVLELEDTYTRTMKLSGRSQGISETSMKDRLELP